MEKLKSKNEIKIPKAPGSYNEITVEPLEGMKGLYRVFAGNFKGLLKEKQLNEIRKQIVKA